MSGKIIKCTVDGREIPVKSIDHMNTDASGTFGDLEYLETSTNWTLTKPFYFIYNRHKYTIPSDRIVNFNKHICFVARSFLGNRAIRSVFVVDYLKEIFMGDATMIVPILHTLLKAEGFSTVQAYLLTFGFNFTVALPKK